MGNADKRVIKCYWYYWSGYQIKMIQYVTILFLLFFIPSINYAGDYDFDSMFDNNSQEKADSTINPSLFLEDVEDASRNVNDVYYYKYEQPRGASPYDSSGSGSHQNNYTCSFHCVGQWESWRGSEHKVKISASTEVEAEDNTKNAYQPLCKKYPFHEGHFGGGHASVGKVSCQY